MSDSSQTPQHRPDPDHDDEEPISLFREFIWFIRENRKWWLIPLVVIILALAVLLVLGTNPATAPFIYTLF